MANRNNEWALFVQDIKHTWPIELEDCAQRAVALSKSKARTGLWVTIPVAGVCVALIALTAACNTSPGLARTAKEHPVLRSLVRLLTANPSLRAITAGTPVR